MPWLVASSATYPHGRQPRSTAEGPGYSCGGDDVESNDNDDGAPAAAVWREAVMVEVWICTR